MKARAGQALPTRPSPAAAGARLGELYAAHARMVFGICRMLLHDADEAEDATQQVFLAAYRSLLTGTDVRDPAAWLGTIARNACRRRATAITREPLALADGPTITSPAADDAAIGREETAALYEQLAILPVRQREAVVLRDLYGLRYAEVAKALGTSRPAVEGLLIRGRRQLRRRLRPGVAAGVLAVPLAIQESIAYAVPGFASAATPTGAAAAAVGIPLAAKLATGGAALALAGSAGVVAERSIHDPPARANEPPAAATTTAEARATTTPGTTETDTTAPVSRQQLPPLLPVPAGGFPVAERDNEDDNSGPGRDENDHDNSGPGPGRGRDEDDHDNSGPGGGREDEPRVAVLEVDPDEGPAHHVDDNSGPGSSTGQREPEDNSGQGSGGDLEDAEDHGGGDSSGSGGGGSSGGEGSDDG